MTQTRYMLVASVLGSLLVPAVSQAQDCKSNLMIVIDRSCSMTNQKINGKARWDIAVDAINSLMAKNSGQLNFGLAMFPTKTTVSPKCVQNGALLPPAPNQVQTVTTLLANNRPGSPCITNIDEGIKQASAEPSLFTTDRRSFVLLLTDGAQSNDCNGGSATADPLTVQYIKDMYDKKVPTYVVGFDIGTNAGAQKSLNNFAIAGGLPNSDATLKYYPANDQAELEATLAKLAGLSGGEVSICRGQPCPDGRCLSATASCTSGFCVEPVSDMAGQGGGTDDGGTDGGGSVASGCSCQLGGQAATSSAGLSALAIGGALLLLRRRRQAALRS